MRKTRGKIHARDFLWNSPKLRTQLDLRLKIIHIVMRIVLSIVIKPHKVHPYTANE